MTTTEADNLRRLLLANVFPALTDAQRVALEVVQEHGADSIRWRERLRDQWMSCEEPAEHKQPTAGLRGPRALVSRLRPSGHRLARHGAHGWLGIITKLESPPEFYTRQNGGNPPGHSFGAEIGLEA